MPEHCEQKFTVYSLEPSNGGTYYPASILDDKVHFCPFCGCDLRAPIESISPAPKRERQSKRGQGYYSSDE